MAILIGFSLTVPAAAQSLKLAINLLNNLDATDPHKADIDSSFHKYALFSSAIGSVKADIDSSFHKYALFSSAIGSVMGCVFLMLSIVDFVQVNLGILSCGDEPVYAIVTLVVLVGSALLVCINACTGLCQKMMLGWVET
ncbi:unnamed protein product [Fraxinus pennsylvanica]|uniref:Uncharacterized protein n=1 Tax=Fraxinus pennsylvanica TaxID=56036 RepID=A0AAD1ZVS5_9LAMI|nr:unnamed protein product [Fraxinus pennsylvanica]